MPQFSSIKNASYNVLANFKTNELEKSKDKDFGEKLELNFSKGLISREDFSKGIDTLDLIKGNRAQIGEQRTWNNKQYSKTHDGWAEYKEEKDEQPKTGKRINRTKDDSQYDEFGNIVVIDPIDSHVSKTPTDILQKFIENSEDETLLAKAKTELEKRGVLDSELHDDDKKSLEEFSGKDSNPFVEGASDDNKK